MTLAERDQRIVDGYRLIFDDATRLAHAALLAWATEDPGGDGWPEPRDVIRFARFYNVPAARLGGLVGLLPRRLGSRTIWADMARSPEVGHRIGIESFGREALLGYGMFRATWAQFMRGSLTVH